MDNQQTDAGLALAVKFHDTYERLAPSFGYETRTETRQFSPDTPNGKLMIAVCTEILNDGPVEDLENIEQISDYIDQGLEGVATLEYLRSFIANSQSLTPNEIRLIDISMESIRGLLGYEKSPSYKVAIESFVAVDGKKDRVALEGAITDVLDKIWETIKAFFVKFFAAMKDLFSSKAATTIKDRVDSVKEDVKNIKGKHTLKSETLTNAHIAGVIRHDGEANAQTFAVLAFRTEQLCMNLHGAIRTFQVYVEGVKRDKDYERASTDLDDAGEAVAKTLTKSLGSFYEKQQLHDQLADVYSAFPNQYALAIHPDSMESPIKTRFTMARIELETGDNVSEEVQALTYEQIGPIIRHVEIMLDAIAKTREEVSLFGKIQIALNGTLQDMRQSGSVREEAGAMKVRLLVIRKLSTMTRDLASVVSRASFLLRDTAKAGSEYAALSLANFEVSAV